MRMVQCISNLLRAGHRRHYSCHTADVRYEIDMRIGHVCPAEKRVRLKGRAPQFPRGTVFDCPACVRRKLAGRPEHTRNRQPPLLCRHFDHENDEYDCPKCRSGIPLERMFDHPGHTYDERCRHGDAYRTRTMKRHAGLHRDLAVPLAGAPRPNPLSGLDDGKGDEDPSRTADVVLAVADVVEVGASEGTEPLAIGLLGGGLAPPGDVVGRSTDNSTEPSAKEGDMVTSEGPRLPMFQTKMWTTVSRTRSPQ